MDEHLYHYLARVTAVYDGDTCTVDIDLGLNVVVHSEKLRLNRIDAPEISGVENRSPGLAARDALRALVFEKLVHIKTIKDRREKYGRYLAEISVERTPGEWTNVNDLLVLMGHAVYRSY